MALSAQLSTTRVDAPTVFPGHPSERPEIPAVLARYLALMARPSGSTEHPHRLMVLLVGGAVSLVEHRFAQTGVRLHIEVSPQLPVIHGEPRLLEHAVVNLMLHDTAGQPGRQSGDMPRGTMPSAPHALDQWTDVYYAGQLNSRPKDYP